MRSLRMTCRRAVALFAVALFSTFTVSHAESIPGPLVGTWQIVEVHINTESSRTTSYSWNDPRLLWRIFTFSAAEITSDTPESSSCMLPQAAVADMSLTKLFGDSLAGYGYPAEKATPKDYSLKPGSTDMAKVISVTCQSGLWQGGLGADGGLQGAWMYIAPDGRLVLRWYDETILVLKHLDAAAKPRASFDCAKAGSSTEKTICQSLQLASFDRSVASAYLQARTQAKQDGDGSSELLSSQKAWMHQRDACQADAKCILQSLKGRLDQLTSADQN